MAHLCAHSLSLEGAAGTSCRRHSRIERTQLRVPVSCLPVTTATFVPFRRGRFEDLTRQPRLPHPYFDVPAERVQVTTPELGTLGAEVRVHGSGPPLLLVHGLM